MVLRRVTGRLFNQPSEVAEVLEASSAGSAGATVEGA